MKEIYTSDELASKLGVSKRILHEWEKEELLKPSGIADEGSQLYTSYQLERGQHLKKLYELGYGMEAIKKIIKKVGLPKSSAENNRQNLNETYLTVGQLAEAVKVSPRTIKHWEDIGIIEPDMRSEGGYRLFAPHYVFICNLIKDLQLFGYSLEEIKNVSVYFRGFLDLNSSLDSYPVEESEQKLNELIIAIDGLSEKMDLFKAGIARWEDLLKKKKKEIIALKTRNSKRIIPS
ncbi:MAG: MerR family transcriptional regulator [Ignavibacteriales bacterium]|nr:MerR family transcriptional regulator [Ignavibacteriales bacterium]